MTIQKASSIWIMLVISFTTLCAQNISAQNATTRTGTVVDPEGVTIPGVTVNIQGTSRGTATNGQGQYSINAEDNDRLIFRSIGFGIQEVPVNGRTVIDITMQPEASALDEVVVVGYGTQKREDLTGAVASLQSEEIENTVSTTFDQALQGKVAGVTIIQNSGEPGGGIQMQIRGISTLNSGQQPLYVIDGVFYGGSSNSQVYTGGVTPTNPLSTINPADIESIDVLKDASATAIYGSRGSNGVVIVTTKRGKQGKPKFEFDAYYGIQQLPKLVDVMDLQQYAEFRNERARVFGWGAVPEFQDPSVLGPGTNWQEEIYQNAPMQSYNLSVSGGSDNTNYTIAGGYFDQDGIAIASDFKRYSMRVNVDNQTTEWLKIGTSVNLSHVVQNINNDDGNLVNLAIRQSPDIPVRNPDGTYGGPADSEFSLSNPVAIASITLNERKRSQIFGNVYSDIYFLKNFTLRNELTGWAEYGNMYQFTPTYQFGALINEQSSGSIHATNGYNYTFRSYLSYNRLINDKHQVDATLGHEAFFNEYRFVSGGRINYFTNSISELNVGDAESATANSGRSQNSIESYFGRANYSYDGRYLFTATVRGDGSSNFAEGNKWNLSSAFAFAWRLSEEAFLENVEKISDLKLRLNYGILNNQGIPNYTYGTTYSPVQTGIGQGVLVSNLQNPGVQWEETESYGAGLDAGFFNNRLNITFDYYFKKTRNLLLSLPLPLYSGTQQDFAPGQLSPPFYNIGSIQNQGLELSINSSNIQRKDFSWNTNITLTHNRNKVLDLVTDASIIPTYVETDIISQTSVGSSIGEFYGYEVVGIFQDQEDLESSARPEGTEVGVNGVWVGDLKFRDQNMDGVINEQDRTYLGSPQPIVQYGFSNNLKYKNFELTIFFNGNYGNKIFNYVRRVNEDPRSNFGLLEQVSEFARIGVEPDGDPNNVEDVYLINGDTDIPRVSQSNANINDRPSSRYIEDGSYLRLKNLVLAYNLPQRWTSQLKLTNCRIYTNIQNLFTITEYTGYDPEVGSRTSNALSMGIDNGRYPSQRIYTFGVKVGF